MRSLFLLFISFGFVASLTACGSSEPLARGKKMNVAGRGLPKAGTPPGVPGNPPTEEKPGDGGDDENGGGESPTPEPSPEPLLDRAFFEQNLSPSIKKTCFRCHSDRDFHTYEVAIALVVPGSPESSVLYQRVTGNGHAIKWSSDSAEAAVLANWINGAKL